MSETVLSAREIAEKIARAAMNICGVAVSQVDAGNWGMDKYDEAKAEMTKIIEAALIAERADENEACAKNVSDLVDALTLVLNENPADHGLRAQITTLISVCAAIRSRQTPTGTGE